ncbi:MAG: prolipoprotein diacylglyceryl transferase [Synergistaceae bacterium]|jgi:phosphatidylglycerol:prolipoprotein diacylglycerol transferase|nr:prolipoprotein diacylglyceryl transferase [Synergistaceae bacterium]
MYPVLFNIFSVPVETYYVIWFIALSLAMAWSTRRFGLYGLDEDEGRRVTAWAFLGMLFGARAFEYIWNFSAYLRNPSLFFDLSRGGLSEVGAIGGAFLTAFFLCRGNPKVSLTRLCDIASPPVAMTMAVGRWGCFSAGCCVGVPSAARFALHFPYDAAGIARHPTQIYYSLSSALILLALLWIESRTVRRKILPGGSLVSPAALLLYSVMRLAIDPLRAEADSSGLFLSHAVLLIAMPFEAIWLGRSFVILKKTGGLGLPDPNS